MDGFEVGRLARAGEIPDDQDRVSLWAAKARLWYVQSDVWLVGFDFEVIDTLTDGDCRCGIFVRPSFRHRLGQIRLHSSSLAKRLLEYLLIHHEI